MSIEVSSIALVMHQCAHNYSATVHDILPVNNGMRYEMGAGRALSPEGDFDAFCFVCFECI